MPKLELVCNGAVEQLGLTFYKDGLHWVMAVVFPKDGSGGKLYDYGPRL